MEGSNRGSEYSSTVTRPLNDVITDRPSRQGRVSRIGLDWVYWRRNGTYREGEGGPIFESFGGGLCDWRAIGAQVPRWFLDPDFKPDLTWYLHGDTQSTVRVQRMITLC
jgi:hypothetical protein